MTWQADFWYLIKLPPRRRARYSYEDALGRSVAYPERKPRSRKSRALRHGAATPMIDRCNTREEPALVAD